MKEAGDYIAFVLDERLALRKIYSRKFGAELLSSSWVRGISPCPAKTFTPPMLPVNLVLVRG
jgi:hypothetical protein